MRELTINEVHEVHDVSGGWFIFIIIAINNAYKDKPVDGNAPSTGEMPPGP